MDTEHMIGRIQQLSMFRDISVLVCLFKLLNSKPSFQEFFNYITSLVLHSNNVALAGVHTCFSSPS